MRHSQVLRSQVLRNHHHDREWPRDRTQVPHKEHQEVESRSPGRHVGQEVVRMGHLVAARKREAPIACVRWPFPRRSSAESFGPTAEPSLEADYNNKISTLCVHDQDCCPKDMPRTEVASLLRAQVPIMLMMGKYSLWAARRW